MANLLSDQSSSWSAGNNLANNYATAPATEQISWSDIEHALSLAPLNPAGNFAGRSSEEIPPEKSPFRGAINSHVDNFPAGQESPGLKTQTGENRGINPNLVRLLGRMARSTDAVKATNEPKQPAFNQPSDLVLQSKAAIGLAIESQVQNQGHESSEPGIDNDRKSCSDGTSTHQSLSLPETQTSLPLVDVSTIRPDCWCPECHPIGLSEDGQKGEQSPELPDDAEEVLRPLENPFAYVADQMNLMKAIFDDPQCLYAHTFCPDGKTVETYTAQDLSTLTKTLEASGAFQMVVQDKYRRNQIEHQTFSDGSWSFSKISYADFSGKIRPFPAERLTINSDGSMQHLRLTPMGQEESRLMFS